MFRVAPCTAVVDQAFLSVVDAEAVFCRDLAAVRQQLLDTLCFGAIDVRQYGVAPEAAAPAQRIVSSMQIALQYLVHRLGLYSTELKKAKKERDELFEELLDLREVAAVAQHHLRHQERERERERASPTRHSKAVSQFMCGICGKVYPEEHALQSHKHKRHKFPRGLAGSPALSVTPTPEGAAAQYLHSPAPTLVERLEAAEVSSLKTEIGALRRSFDEVMVEVKVARELQREHASREPSPQSIPTTVGAETLAALRAQSQRLDAIEQAIVRSSVEWQLSSVSASSGTHAGRTGSPATTGPSPTAGVAQRYAGAVAASQETVVVSAPTSTQTSSERPIPSAGSPTVSATASKLGGAPKGGGGGDQAFSTPDRPTKASHFVRKPSTGVLSAGLNATAPSATEVVTAASEGATEGRTLVDPLSDVTSIIHETHQRSVATMDSSPVVGSPDSVMSPPPNLEVDTSRDPGTPTANPLSLHPSPEPHETAAKEKLKAGSSRSSSPSGSSSSTSSDDVLDSTGMAALRQRYAKEASTKKRTSLAGTVTSSGTGTLGKRSGKTRMSSIVPLDE